MNATVFGRATRPFASTAMAIALALALVAGTVAPASAQGERAGDAVVTVAGEPGTALGSGGSATVFGLRLPGGAACQGDSAHDDYRIKSFIVPDTADPGSLVFGELAPQVAGSWPLWAESTDPYVNGFTGEADPGQPGPISNLPNFTFNVLLPGELAAGSYRIGVLCYHDNETTRYWDTAFVVTADPSDQPAQIHWTNSSTGGTGGSATSAGPYVVGGLLVLLLVLGIAWLVMRRHANRSSRPPVQQELS